MATGLAKATRACGTVASVKRREPTSDLFAAHGERERKRTRRSPSACGRATLDEFVGQAHLLGPGASLREMVESGSLHSLILWGPPGTGKTTLAHLLAQAAQRASSSRSRRCSRA